MARLTNAERAPVVRDHREIDDYLRTAMAMLDRSVLRDDEIWTQLDLAGARLRAMGPFLVPPVAGGPPPVDAASP